MKDQLQALFNQAIKQLKADQVIPAEHEVSIQFERTRQKEHGDFATNLAMTLAKPARRNPRELAELIVSALPSDGLITKVDIAGPGFINVFLAQDARYSVLNSIFEQGDRYGLGEPNSKQKIMVEFVSANPTGPLHVGHGRGAAYGDALARLLTAAGNTVEREYYVNDAGRQMDILAVSVWIRYLQAHDLPIDLPSNCYKGDYVNDYGEDLAKTHGQAHAISLEAYNRASLSRDQSSALTELKAMPEEVFEKQRKALNLSVDEFTEKFEKRFLEESLDTRIEFAKTHLGDEGFEVFFKRALDSILEDIRQDLSEFGVDYDTWFSERSLFDEGKINKALDQLKASGDVYEKGGAWWFKTTDYGDEKDRVVIRDNGQPTYFASDIAYHADKLERGFDLAINVWGSDHHGYIPRVKASLEALGLDQEKLKVVLVQFAVLYRGGEKIGMSTRSGDFVTLRELREEVGSDAARFFYVQRKSEQHMDFDLDLAKSQSKDNPMYYVQYAHARTCRIFKTADMRGIDTSAISQADFSRLKSDQENILLSLLQRFPELVQAAATNYEPHQITYYLRDLATALQSYYAATKILDADVAQRNAMLALCSATRQTLRNGLSIIGVGAPESM
ncbi:MAG: arginine--tRNA ligase [Arenicella sp.]|nr:arginine--tRNA ligase [Arenicella sp.]